MVYKFISIRLSNESYYTEHVRHLAKRSGEHNGISPSSNERVQPSKDNGDHLLNFRYSPSFEDFSVLSHENKKFLL